MNLGGKHLIGWTELVAFPDWEVPRVQAKIDTGARTSALHVENLRRVGTDRVAFDVIVGRRKNQRSHPVEADVVKWASVRS
ncbi:MAG: ATP-dependent zinc protease, partial [Candidatus Sumerlaeia bacterium]|nr:ATP-dependent zinc protease [Candidatus Sumerlaeia bacterium]